MPGPFDQIQPTHLQPVTDSLREMSYAQRSLSTDILTAAIVQAMGRPVSIREVLEIKNDIFYATNSTSNSGGAQAFRADSQNKLARVWE